MGFFVQVVMSMWGDSDKSQFIYLFLSLVKCSYNVFVYVQLKSIVLKGKNGKTGFCLSLLAMACSDLLVVELA